MDLSEIPTSLPPLIQTLVGKLQSDEERKPNLIRSNLKKNEEDLTMGRKSIKRMIDYNLEWEDSLRWISKWGEQEYLDSNHGDNSRSTTVGSRREHRDTSEMKKKKKKGGKRDRSHEQRRGVKSKNKVQCTDQCRREHGLSHPRDIETFFLRRTLDRYRTFLDVHFHTLRKLLGIVFSTSIVWLTRNGMQWWKLNQYSHSLRALLLEESNVGVTKTISNTTTPAKKTKRSKQKQKSDMGGEKRTRIRKGVQQDESEESDDDSVERFYVLHNKKKTSPSKVSDSKVASKSKSSNSQNIETPSKGPLDVSMTQRVPSNKKTFPKQTETNRNKSKGRLSIGGNTSKLLSQEELEESIYTMALFQTRQLDRILNEQLECYSVGRLSDLLLSDLPKYYKAENMDKRSIIHSNQGTLRVTEQTESSLDTNLPEEDKEHLEQHGVSLILSNILSDDEDDDADKTWASSTSSSTKPESQLNSKETGRSIALGDLLVSSIGNDVYNSTKPVNPWNTHVEPISAKEKYESLESKAETQILLWGDSNSERIW